MKQNKLITNGFDGYTKLNGIFILRAQRDDSGNKVTMVLGKTSVPFESDAEYAQDEVWTAEMTVQKLTRYTLPKRFQGWLAENLLCATKDEVHLSMCKEIKE